MVIFHSYVSLPEGMLGDVLYQIKAMGFFQILSVGHKKRYVSVGFITSMNFIWVTKNNPPSPRKNTIFIGGMFTIPSHGWFMALFYPHYYS